MKLILNLFKLRIGVAIALAAAAGLVVQEGERTAAGPALVLVLAVLLASAAAGAFNQYVERDIDRRMARTRNRPFVTGELRHGPFWLWVIGAMLAASVLAAALASNVFAAVYVFLGAFTYGVVYTVWLKRRTRWNIVVGGLAGSFAVLAGAAAVSPEPSPAALSLAVVLFLWTPPHFWSLAIACRDDYAAAGVPMLPVVSGIEETARQIVLYSWTMVAISLLLHPVAQLGNVYLASAVVLGAVFLREAHALGKRARTGGKVKPMRLFHWSITYLTLLFAAMAVDQLV